MEIKDYLLSIHPELLNKVITNGKKLDPNDFCILDNEEVVIVNHNLPENNIDSVDDVSTMFVQLYFEKKKGKHPTHFELQSFNRVSDRTFNCSIFSNNANSMRRYFYKDMLFIDAFYIFNDIEERENFIITTSNIAHRWIVVKPSNEIIEFFNKCKPFSKIGDVVSTYIDPDILEKGNYYTSEKLDRDSIEDF